jgi:hypothetical protein
MLDDGHFARETGLSLLDHHASGRSCRPDQTTWHPVQDLGLDLTVISFAQIESEEKVRIDSMEVNDGKTLDNGVAQRVAQSETDGDRWDRHRSGDDSHTRF